MHSGHFNAIRQAKGECDVLVVGIHSDEEITNNKAPPVIKQAERYALLEHIKWIDEILYDVPYSPSLATLDLARADYCVHGDDMPIGTNGKCAYDDVINAKRMKIIKRTEGVSTTDIVGRLLLLTRDHLNDPQAKAAAAELTDKSSKSKVKMLTTTRRIAEFSSRTPVSATDKVVYMDGAFDMFHVGHASTLKKARELGTYLIVGIFDDETVNQMKGSNLPIMNLHERVLNVCSCKWVDDIIIGAPPDITEDMITTLNISIVAQGKHTASEHHDNHGQLEQKNSLVIDKGMFREVSSDWPELSTAEIARRISENRRGYEQRNAKRTKIENDYYKAKIHREEV